MANNKNSPKKPVSTSIILLSAIVSCLVAVALYIGLAWLAESTDQASLTDTQEAIMVLGVVLALTIGPGIIAAGIVITLQKRNKR